MVQISDLSSISIPSELVDKYTLRMPALVEQSAEALAHELCKIVGTKCLTKSDGKIAQYNFISFYVEFNFEIDADALTQLLSEQVELGGRNTNSASFTFTESFDNGPVYQRIFAVVRVIDALVARGGYALLECEDGLLFGSMLPQAHTLRFQVTHPGLRYHVSKNEISEYIKPKLKPWSKEDK